MKHEQEYTLNLSKFQYKENENLFDTIKKEHLKIKYIYEQFLINKSAEIKNQLKNELIRQISVHTAAEEMVLYPVIKEKLSDRAYMTGLNEHMKIKRELNKISSMFTDLGYDTYYNLIKDFILHSDKEEREIILDLCERLRPQENIDITKSFINKREQVPTRPHPFLPDAPPNGNIVGSVQAPIDKALDKISRDFPDVNKC